MTHSNARIWYLKRVERLLDSASVEKVSLQVYEFEMSGHQTS